MGETERYRKEARLAVLNAPGELDRVTAEYKLFILGKYNIPAQTRDVEIDM